MLFRSRLFHVRQARLANLAFAHQTLADFAQRLARARITGRLRLQNVAPGDEHYCATLTALDAHQSVIEEHFTDGDIMDLADVMGFLTGQAAVEVSLRVEDIGEKLLFPIRTELEREGVNFDATADSVEERRENA